MENQKILLVTGKGGVGKSTVAAATALKLARQGKKVLLAEVGEKSFYRYVFEKEIGHEPTLVENNFWVTRWEGEHCLREYIAHFVKIEKIVNLFFDNKVMKALVQAAPALKELAIIGKLTSGRRNVGPKMPYDFIVMDAYSTGHFKALVMAPIGMGEAIPVGPMGDQCRSIAAELKNQETVQTWIVSLPEELPVSESIELQEFLSTQMGMQSKFILNRVFNTEVQHEDCKSIELVDSNEDFLSYLCASLKEQDKARTQLGDGLHSELPLEFSDVSMELLNRMVERIVLPWNRS